MPIAHASLPVSDIQTAKAFYTAAIAPLKYKLAMDFGEVACGFGVPGGKNDFWLVSTGGAKAQKMHLAFTGESEEEVKEFHAAALYVWCFS